ncbi:MAG: DNA polymerase, partial [Dehalococcoidia bacterium]
MTTAPAPPRLVLLDGHGIIFRAFFAQRDNPLSVRRTGEITSAVFGFANTLLKVISDLKPTHLAVTMDRAAPTFRHQADAGYKANRAAMPDELRPQIARVRELIDAFSIPIYESDGYEADDMLGTLACQAAEQGIDTYLVTLDSDIVQLVQPHVAVYMYLIHQRDTRIYAEVEEVKERYGVRPDQIPDLKALKGDTSDNIPGVPGVGEKTAVKLLNQFDHVENIYEYLWQVSPSRIQEALRTGEAQVRKSKELATIVCDVPVTLDLDRCRVDDYDRERVLELFRELEFRSLLPRLPEVDAALAGTPQQPVPDEHPCIYTTVLTLDLLDDIVARIRAAGSMALDTETTSQSAMLAKLVGISLAVEPYEAWYVPVGHAAEGDPTVQLPLADVLDRLRPVFAEPSIKKTGHNLKYDMTVLANAGAPVQGVTDDTMIAAYLLGEAGIGLKALAFSELGVEMTPITELIGTGRKQISMDQVEVDKAAAYASADADLALRLRDVLIPRLEQAGHSDLYNRIEIPLISVLTRMERRGVALDTDVLREMSQRLGEELARREQAFHELIEESLDFVGKIVVEQTLPNGTREYMIEAETASGGDEPWRLALSFRWPREMDAELEEGDFSLAGPSGSAVNGALRDGSAEAVFDEETADKLVRIDLRFELRSGEGAYVDRRGAVRVGGALVGDEARLAVRWTAGERINLNSPRQLSALFFEKLNLPKTRPTTLGWSTDAQAMERLRGTHPAVDLLFEYREVAKLKSTYVDALPGLINPDTGRIHTNYNQARAATGRLSSEDPNLQNIPIRTELGRQVRRAFIARDGDEPRLFLGADYSQVELRILAHISQEPFLLDAFGRDEDIHRATAATLFNIPPEQVTYE